MSLRNDTYPIQIWNGEPRIRDVAPARINGFQPPMIGHIDTVTPLFNALIIMIPKMYGQSGFADNTQKQIVFPNLIKR